MEISQRCVASAVLAGSIYLFASSVPFTRRKRGVTTTSVNSALIESDWRLPVDSIYEQGAVFLHLEFDFAEMQRIDSDFLGADITSSHQYPRDNFASRLIVILGTVFVNVVEIPECV